MAKSKQHGIGLCKNHIVIDPSRTNLNTITVFVDDAATLNNVDGDIDSKKYHWAPRQSVNVVSLSDAGNTISAAVVKIEACCLGRKPGRHLVDDGDDDLIVTLYYDDGSGGTETDECTFTDVEYDSTTAPTMRAINSRPTTGQRESQTASTSRRGGNRQGS